MSARNTSHVPSSAGPTTGRLIYVVDDDESFRMGIIRLLRGAGYDARGFGSAGEFLLAYRDKSPGCVLLDVGLPGPSGLDLQETLGRMEEPLPVIFISGQGTVHDSVRAMKAGAADFLTKPVRRELLFQAIEKALSGGMKARLERDDLRAARCLFESLTPRERQVFSAIIGGKLNKEVAEELGTTERTIKAQRASVMTKMKASSFAELVRIGYRLQASETRPVDRLPSS